VSVVPPLGNTRWTRYTPDSSAVGEQVALHVGRVHAPQGDIPVLFFHDYQATAVDTLDGGWDGLFSAITSTSYPMLAAQLGGVSQWATPDVVGASGWVDDAIVWAAGQVWIGTRTDKIAVVGIGMGTLNALNWAWRNPGRVLSVALIGPIVDADAFYTDNPSLQAAINADWGGAPAWTAALPTIDPMANLDQIRPFAHKIGLWYGDADTQINPSDVQAFAELTGATATEFAGTQSQRHLVPSGLVAAELFATLRDRRSAYVGWEPSDWARFDVVNTTVDPDPADRNVNEVTTAIHPGGRRGEFHRLSGTSGNERHVYLLRELTAVDSYVSGTWYQENGGLMVGQQGNVHAGHVEAGAYLFNMVWGDIFGVSPWIVNMGVWSGTVDDDDLVLLGNTNKVIPGLRLSAGGEVLASERIGGVVTLVVHADDLDRNLRSRTLNLVIAGPLGNHNVVGATRLDANHITYAQAGVDIPNGGAGSWADFGSCYPFRADTQKVGAAMLGRFYPRGIDPPAWDDPDFTMTWTDSGSWGYEGYAPCGQLFAHVGLFDGRPHNLQVGPLRINEM